MPRFTAALAIAIVAWVSPLSAQSFGIRAAGTANPDQLQLGGHYDFRPVWEQMWVRPVGSIGVGNDATLIAMNLHALYSLPFGRGRLGTIYAGGGPGWHLFRLNGYSTSRIGFSAVSGLRHPRGMFAEAHVGFLDSPEVGIAVGYTWTPNRRVKRKP
jgi:hypothetical protein